MKEAIPFIQALYEDKKVIVMLRLPEPDWQPAHFGLVICDLVRHVAKAFNAPENAVWEWVDKERTRPTTEITQVKPS